MAGCNTVTVNLELTFDRELYERLDILARQSHRGLAHIVAQACENEALLLQWIVMKRPRRVKSPFEVTPSCLCSADF